MKNTGDIKRRMERKKKKREIEKTEYGRPKEKKKRVSRWISPSRGHRDVIVRRGGGDGDGDDGDFTRVSQVRAQQ